MYEKGANLPMLKQRNNALVKKIIYQRSPISRSEIAQQLLLSEGSVKQYVKQIYSKLHIDGDTRTKRRRLNELLEAKA